MDSDQDKQEENLQEETPSSAAPQWSSGGPSDNSKETEADDLIMEEAWAWNERERKGIPHPDEEE